MGQPKRHHYLPKSYLLQFGKDAGVWVYDRAHNITRWQQVEDTAVQRNFYAVERPDGTLNLALEVMLSRIEQPIGEICEKLRAKEKLSQKDHESLCLFAGFMMTRTPDFRAGVERTEAEMIKRISRNMFRTVEDAARSLAEWKQTEPTAPDIDPEVLYNFYRTGEFDIRIHKNRSLELMFQLAPSFAEMLLALNLGFLHAPSNAAFVTCDRPLVMLPPRDKSGIPSWSGIGLLTPGAHKYLPLASDLVLAFGDPGNNASHIQLQRHGVMFVNAVVGRMTKRFLFGRDEYLVSRWVERLKLADIPPVEMMTIS